MRAHLFLAPILILSVASPARQASSAEPSFTAAPPMEQLGTESDSPADDVSVRQPKWQHDGGFLIAELTFGNGNAFAVYEVIVTCEFFDSQGLHIGSRGSLIMRVLPPGRTTVDGIEFTMLRGKAIDRDMRGGACAVASATRLALCPVQE